MTVVEAQSCGVERVAVVGAGTMGAGIAAQFANAGIPVDLLDIRLSGADPNSVARKGMERQIKSGGFMHQDAAHLIRCGNIEDHIDRFGAVDWIVEAVKEDLDVKKKLFRRIDAARKEGSIVSSNTSSLLRSDLIEGLGTESAKNFVITHFFNPPRRLPLVELISGPETSPQTETRVRKAMKVLLGKTTIDCRDTPGYIANRICCFWLAMAALEAKRMDLDIELADAVNAALGTPRTGVFGLLDLIGIDVVPLVWGSLLEKLPAEDALHSYDIVQDPLFEKLVATGLHGRKTGGGFYRKTPAGQMEALDLNSCSYRSTRKPLDLPGGGRDLRALLNDNGPAGRYAFSVLSAVISYAATHASEIADDITAIDRAVELGYFWKKGPFTLADHIGVEALVERMRKEARPIPAMLLAEKEGFFQKDTLLKTSGKRVSRTTSASLTDAIVLKGNSAATLHDLGDGIACFRIHSKMNSFAPEVFEVLEWTLENSGQRFDGLVLASTDPRAFSTGADLSFFRDMITSKRTGALEDYLQRGQDLFLSMRRSAIPVVAAAHGFALGGGCEFMLHADAIIAHCELTAGLPEVKVGLIPGWGGCAQILARTLAASDGALGPAAALERTFKLIFSGKKTGSALDARFAGLLLPDDQIAMHQDLLVPAAKSRAVELRDSGYVPQDKSLLPLTGASGKAGVLASVSGELAAGRITETDFLLAETLTTVLTGGADGNPAKPATEEDIMRLERMAVLHLVTQPTTLSRIDHMLKTGKPLRN